jgi:hypothetical protein
MNGKEKIERLLEDIAVRINDPEKANTEPEWVFWCLFVDAAKMYVELTGNSPKIAHIPSATISMMQQYVNKMPKPFDVRDGILGMVVIPGSQSVWFES